MSDVIQRCFGGLTGQYYFRQRFFAAVVGFAMLWRRSGAWQHLGPGLLPGAAVNTLLYPYARFVWEALRGSLSAPTSSSCRCR